jgi:hypothetical protein
VLVVGEVEVKCVDGSGANKCTLNPVTSIQVQIAQTGGAIGVPFTIANGNVLSASGQTVSLNNSVLTTATSADTFNLLVTATFAGAETVSVSHATIEVIDLGP